MPKWNLSECQNGQYHRQQSCQDIFHTAAGYNKYSHQGFYSLRYPAPPEDPSGSYLPQNSNPMNRYSREVPVNPHPRKHHSDTIPMFYRLQESDHDIPSVKTAVYR